MLTGIKARVRRTVGIALPTVLVILSSYGSATASENTVTVDRLLPKNTLFVFSVDDSEKYAAAAESLPFAKIMAEADMQTFLEKPKAALKEAISKLNETIKKEEGFENFELSADALTAGKYGRIFFALTHVSLPDFQNGVGPDVGLIVGVEGREGAPDWSAMVKDLISRSNKQSGQSLTFAPVTEGGLTWDALQGLPPDAPPLLFAKVGGMQLFSLSTTAMKSVLARAQGAGDAENVLANNANYSAAREQLAFNGGDSVHFFVNAELAIKTAAEGIKMGLEMGGEAQSLPLVDTFIDKLGLNALKSIAFADHPENGVSHTRVWVGHEGERKGLLALAPDKPINLDLLSMAGDNTASVSLFQFDVSKLYDLAMDLVKTADEATYTEVQGMLAGFGGQLSGDPAKPIDIRNDIFANIGPEFALIQPKSANAMMPSMLFVADLRNGATVTSVLGKLIQMGGQMSGSGVAVKEVDYKGTKITQIDLGSDLPIAVTPCYAEFEGKLLISLAVGDLKRQLKRKEKPGPSITESEDFKRFWDRVPKDDSLRAFSYSDTKYAVESAYGQIAMTLPMLSMATGGQELPFDPSQLPTQDIITKHLFGSMSYGTTTDKGSLAESYGPFGGEVVMGVAVGAAAVGAVLLPARMTMDVAPPVEVMPSEPEPLASTPSDQAMTDMKNLRRAITFYKLDKSSLPENLSQLLEPTPSYPKGCLGADALPKDPWGGDYHFRAEGTGYTLWSNGPDGVDNGATGDDVFLKK